MRTAFWSVAGNDMEVDAYELKDLLNHGDFLKSKKFAFS